MTDYGSKNVAKHGKINWINNFSAKPRDISHFDSGQSATRDEYHGRSCLE